MRYNWYSWSALWLMLIIPSLLLAQNDIENVEVEIYYITDANDATDQLGGGVAEGSITYRVFIDLCDSCSLRAIYGDENHPLVISSTANFFNNTDRGRTYGHEINNSALDENTVALDSWLSIGAASNQRAGIPKSEDPDGSMIGGANNDGGSEGISGGLLVNMDPLAGVAITGSDGLMPLDGVLALPPNFNLSGEDPQAVFKDSTAASDYSSNDVRIGCSTPGVRGATAANKVLIAQLTTTGELTFKLNIEVEKPGGVIVKYVSSDDVLLPGEVPNGLLSYPPVCGCIDPNFLEYDPSAGCDDGSCATSIQYGCLDTLACNNSDQANFHVQQLCCYGPDDCNGLDIAIVCPYVGIDGQTSFEGLIVAPNPIADLCYIRVPLLIGSFQYHITDALGRTLLSSGIIINSGEPEPIHMEQLRPGIHYLHLFNEGIRRTIPIMKI